MRIKWAVPLGVLWLTLLLVPLRASAARDEAFVTLRTAAAVRKAFENTTPITQDSGTLKVPAVVSDQLFARFFVISKTLFPEGGNAAWVKQQFALGRQGIGRYFVFIGDHTLIEKALIAGQFNPNQIMADVGFGAGASCANDQNYWLVVFKPKTQPISAVYTHNLQKWFDHVYGPTHAPRISDEIVQSLYSNRFHALTACPLDPTTGAFRYSDLELCAPVFTHTVNALRQNQCANPNTLTYAPSNQCPSDQILESFGHTPSALELRAWLFASNSFSEFFTGYGYSGNAYNTPSTREYWVDNAWLRNLPEVELLNVQCPLSPAPKAAPVMSVSGEAPTERPHSAFVEVY